MRTVQLIVEKNKDGFWGQLAEFSDVFCQGETLDELKANCNEAYELYCETTQQKAEKLGFEIVVDLTQFFELNDYINISKLANRIGINQSLLRQYAKGLKYPSIKQVEKIQRTVQKVGEELMNTKLKPAM